MNRREYDEQVAFANSPEFKDKLKQLQDAQALEDERIKNLRPLIDRIKFKTWLKIRAIEENPLLKYCL